MANQGDDLPVLVIDGADFSDFDGFGREFSRLLCDYTWRGNLDAFNPELTARMARLSSPKGTWRCGSAEDSISAFRPKHGRCCQIAPRHRQPPIVTSSVCS